MHHIGVEVGKGMWKDMQVDDHIAVPFILNIV
jgi:hypothetical protein